MRYFSSRGQTSGLSFTEAVMMGMADDGGLLLPESLPDLRGELPRLRGKPYAEVAFEIIKHFADDIPADALRDIIERSYASFDTPDTVPLKKLKSCHLAELFHGPTYAFKDVALQLLGNLFEHILKEKGGHLNIIGATSGDTGSAAIYGVRGKDRINIAILFPEGRVSEIQKLQMAGVPDANVHTLEVAGTFDDCQSIVKALFADSAFKKQHALGAVNSINWARIMAQIVYYFYTYLKLPEGIRVNFAVPTGNFGNIFAGFCAKMMGLPVERLILATNANDILHRFISCGDYSLNGVLPTHSPAMDIQLASNFERYLYYLYGSDSRKVSHAMRELKEHGKISFAPSEIESVRQAFSSCSVSNQEIEETIARVYKEDGYVIDPHTACGVRAAQELGLSPDVTIALSTAHPAKFADVVHDVLGFFPEEPEGIKRLHDVTARTIKTPATIEAVKLILEEIFK